MPGLPYGESIGYATREEVVRARPVSVPQQQKQQHGLTSQSLSVVGQWKVGDGGGGGGGRGLAVLHKYLHPPTWRIPLPPWRRTSIPLAPLPTAPVFTVPPDEKCRAAAAAARPGSVIKRPGSGDEMFGRGRMDHRAARRTGPQHGPLVTKARNRRSALGGTWEHRVTLSSDLGGPRRRRQRQTGTPRQGLQSHPAAGLGHGA